MDIKEKILEAVIRVYKVKGIKLTMDDIAAELSMSKKTIYKVFPDKETIFVEMVDYCFDRIKESEAAIINNNALSTIDKLKLILGVLPDGYGDIDFNQLYMLKDKYPDMYSKIERRLESGWESTLDLIQKGKEEGLIRDVNVVIFKTMMESTLETFFKKDTLARNGISYKQALDEVVTLLLNGILY